MSEGGPGECLGGGGGDKEEGIYIFLNVFSLTFVENFSRTPIEEEMNALAII